MRMVYLDESGMGEERLTVVAAAIVDFDTQWMPLALGLDALKDKWVPPEHRKNFITQGKQILKGGDVFARKKFSEKERLQIMREVIQSIRESGVQFVVGYQGALNKVSKKRPSEVLRQDHFNAMLNCLAYTDVQLRMFYPDELAMVIAEDSDYGRGMVRRITKLMRSPEWIGTVKGRVKEHLPLERIIGPVHFAKKEEDPILQAADVCAFVVRHYAEGQRHGDELFELLAGYPHLETNPRTHENGAFALFRL